MKPMLLKVLTEKVKLPEKIYIQEKLDGIRCIWNGSEMLTRTGQVIVSMPKLLKILKSEFSDTPLDGELYSNELSFKDIISSTRRSENIEEDERIFFYVFDMPIKNLTFEQRLDKLKTLKYNKRVKLLNAKLITTKKKTINDLNIYHNLAEGSVIRFPDGMYDFGKRSSKAFKIKFFYEEEFEIYDTYELTYKEKVKLDKKIPGAKEYANGTFYKDGKETKANKLGGFYLKTTNGETFKVGSGFSEEERVKFWKDKPIGKLATIIYQEYTENNVPRFGTFKEIRDYD